VFPSGAMDRTRWTSSMAFSFSFTWFKSLTFLSLGTYKAYCLCYWSQCRSWLATTNTEQTWYDSYDTWDFTASQATTVQTSIVLCWSSRWTQCFV
jgi:hypothetical protein